MLNNQNKALFHFEEKNPTSLDNIAHHFLYFKFSEVLAHEEACKI